MDKLPSVQRFSGSVFIDVYDKYRPVPPMEIVDKTILFYGGSRPGLVVDLGCGNGIGTYIWHNNADQVIGIDPSDDMLKCAKANRPEHISNVHFRKGHSHLIPFPDRSVDILTISQAFHWMEPEATLKEINRVLKSGGVASIYDCHWPPKGNAVWEAAFIQLFDHVQVISDKLIPPIVKRYPKHEHMSNIRASRYFDKCVESNIHRSKAIHQRRIHWTRTKSRRFERVDCSRLYGRSNRMDDLFGGYAGKFR